MNEGPAIQLDSYLPVKNGETLWKQFEIIETPGHTPGHLSVFDHKNKVLFAGDALAVVHGKIRRMARPVTEDLVLGLQSMLKLAQFPATTICPGHREPLLQAEALMQEFKVELEGAPGWPLFG